MVPLVKRGLGRLDPRRKAMEDSLSIFVYHEVSDHPSPFMNAPNLNVPPLLFAQQMDFIRNHFNIIGPDQLLKGDYQPPAALVTFDDGMLGYFQNALPILTEKKIPSINFLNMETIEGEPSWSGLVTYLTLYDAPFQEKLSRHFHQSPPWAVTLIDPDFVHDYLSTIDTDSLKERVKNFTGAIATPSDLEAVQNNRFVYFGNHLYNHYCTLTLNKEDLQKQYSINQEKINQFPNGRAMFAYPYGRFIHQQTDLLKSWRADIIFYSSEGINRQVSNRFYNRLSIDAHMTQVEDLWGQIRWLEFRQFMKWDYRGQEEATYCN
jgi:hypothetical protein